MPRKSTRSFKAALPNAREPSLVCRSGLHEMTAHNVRIEFVQNKTTGAVYSVRRCKACQSARGKLWHQANRKRKDNGDNQPNA